ncbi:HEAT repeat domain-containing protein [Candidatus Uabimicrobium sp. HlEnr_7]|uniref:HEAT repeat domain-containing protein n=1 Tax=Candidatus Uabimicrobium helgolandensis TaxID=3095367 RepID=UPI003556E504
MFSSYKRIGREFLRVLLQVASIIICFGTLIVNGYSGGEDHVYGIIQKLDNPKYTKVAIRRLVKLKQKAIPYLLREAKHGHNIVRRGWAIFCLSKIGGDRVDAHLQKIHQNNNQPPLVRTWAISARIQNMQLLSELMKMSQYLTQFPVINHPMGKRLLILLDRDKKLSAQTLINIALHIPKLQPVLTKTIIQLNPQNVILVMTSHKNQEMRRLAAGYLATMAQNNNEISTRVANFFQFDVTAKDVPWANGPLFLPRLHWDRVSGQALVENLISWLLWCERMGKMAEQQQIHNNIRSQPLANAVGYPSWITGEVKIDHWLLLWGKVVGKNELLRLLKQQGADKEKLYILNKSPQQPLKPHSYDLEDYFDSNDSDEDW